MTAIESKQIELHGHRVNYRIAGEGPLIVLVHGITSTSECWREVMPWLADRYTVLAPDLLGHGESAKPRGDYSLGAYASGIRDLVVALGYERGTFLGHSLGGGVAMQLAYQFPERCERMVLVSSGGLGPEVHFLLRAAALPGAEWVLPLITRPGTRDAGRAVGRLLGRLGIRPTPDLTEFARGYGSLADAEARYAFIHTLRAVIDPAGQRVSARDRLYLAAEVPSLVIWASATASSRSITAARPMRRCREAASARFRMPDISPARSAAPVCRGVDGVHERDQGAQGGRRRPAQATARRSSCRSRQGTIAAVRIG